MTDTPVEKRSFEQAMAEIKSVVRRLESGGVSLYDSITLYERGAALKAHCESRLKAAEEKVATITLEETGQPKGATPTEGL